MSSLIARIERRLARLILILEKGTLEKRQSGPNVAKPSK
jgi:hypothetical protein